MSNTNDLSFLSQEDVNPVFGTSRDIPKPSSRVPAESSVSWAESSDVTKIFVQYRDKYQCWLCGNDERGLLHVAHLVSKSEPNTFHRFKNAGWLGKSVTHPAHPDNLILLCVACHTRFDHDIPKWVFFPSDFILEVYIEHEKIDFEERINLAETGVHKHRSLPSINVQTATYMPYVLAPEIIKNQPDTFFELPIPRKWKGHPTAAILKSIIGGFVPSTTGIFTKRSGQTFSIGLPTKTRSLLAELIELWSRPDPPVKSVRNPCPQPISVGVENPRNNFANNRTNFHGSSIGGERTLGDMTEFDARELKGASNVEPQRELASISDELSPPLTATTLERNPEEFHLFGPQFTTNNIVDVFMKFSDNSEDNDNTALWEY